MGRRTRFILAVSLGVSSLQLAFRPRRKMCKRTSERSQRGLAEIVLRAFVAQPHRSLDLQTR